MCSLRNVATAVLTIVALAGRVDAQPTPAPGGTALAPADLQALAQAIASQIRRCWAAPAGSPRLVVDVHLDLNRDGSLGGEPVIANHSDDPAFAILVASVVRALKSCQPYRLPAEKYAAWKALELRFDPLVLGPPAPAAAAPPPGAKQPSFDPARIEQLLDKRRREPR